MSDEPDIKLILHIPVGPNVVAAVYAERALLASEWRALSIYAGVAARAVASKRISLGGVDIETNTSEERESLLAAIVELEAQRKVAIEVEDE